MAQEACRCGKAPNAGAGRAFGRERRTVPCGSPPACRVLRGRHDPLGPDSDRHTPRTYDVLTYPYPLSKVDAKSAYHFTGKGAMKDLTLHIEGMSCGHCLNAVNRALGSLPGVQVESVQMGRAALRYDETRTTPGAVAAAVADAGYRATTAA